MTEPAPVISVVTTVFNTGIILGDTLHAVQRSSFKSYEWLIVNDGSTDQETINLLMELETAGSAEIINHLHNKGLPAARNTGIRAARGKYIFFLDSDDLIDPTFLEKAFIFLEANADFSFVNSYVEGFGAQQYKWKGGFHEKDLFLQENRNTSCFMARREVFNSVLFDESMKNGCEDWEFWLQAASKGYWGYTIPEYLFYYRRSVENKWATLSGKAELSAIRNALSERYKDILEKQGFPGPEIASYDFGRISQSIECNKKVGQTVAKHLLCLFPWLEVGGADQFNLQLVRGLKKEGWSVTIITTKKSGHPLHKEFETITDDIFHLANLGNENTYTSYIRYLIDSRQPSCLFLSNSMYGYYLLPWLKQQFPGMPIADYLHCEDPDWYNGGYPFFSACYTGLLDKTYVTSEQLRKWCISKGADKNKIDLCYINVDIKNIRRDEKKRAEIRKQLGVTPDTPLLLYVARLTEQKQPSVLVKVLAMLKKKGLPHKCVIIGDGPEKDSLLEHINRERLNGTAIYIGEKPNNVVMAYMDAADIFFLPSLYEGIALSIYEAMAKELAVVGAAVGGQTELVTPGCGVLIEKEKGEEVKNYSTLLEQLIKDPSLAKTMGKAGRKRVEENFALDQMISKMDNSLSSVRAGEYHSAGFERAYLLVLDRMVYLEKRSEDLQGQVNSKLIQFLSTYRHSYRKARNVYHKVKRALKINIGK